MCCNKWRKFVQYLQTFGAAASCSKTVPCFNVTPTSLQVGSSILSRSTWSNVTSSSRQARRPLHRQLKPLASLMTCIRMNWMSILVSTETKTCHTFPFCICSSLCSYLTEVGEWCCMLQVGGPGVGKTSLVEMLAALSGNRLRVLPMNSATDTTELLGGFEQVLFISK